MAKMGYEEQLDTLDDIFQKKLKELQSLSEDEASKVSRQELGKIGMIDYDGNLTSPYVALKEIYSSQEKGIVLTSDNIEGVFGSLNKYANPSLISSEKDAWANAAAEKHSQNRK